LLNGTGGTIAGGVRPELPDVTIYIESIAACGVDQPRLALRHASPFLLRTVEPSPAAVSGRAIRDTGRRR